MEEIMKLPGGGADLTLAELQGLAARQQVAMETQQQALVARETRLKYLQQQEARHRQLASEQARLQRMRERVEAQELKLKKLRALRGQVEQHKASNGNLNSELEAVRAVFNEKEKELAMAVSKVDQLMRQLQELKEVKANGVITNGNHVKGDPSVVALELDKLRNELLHRNKLNDQQNSRLNAQRQLLQQRKDEVSTMDNRIHELQQRLKKRRSQQQLQQQQQQLPQQQQQPSSNSADSTQKNFNNNNNNSSSTARPGHNVVQRKPGQNIAAVEPYIQYAPKDVAKDDSYSKTGFLKQDPKYQTLPANTKFIPGTAAGEEAGSNKPGGGVGGQQVGEVNNNTTTVSNNKAGGGGSGGVKAVEYKIPTLISSHFDANRGRSNLGNRTGAENQGKGGVVVVAAGAGGPVVAPKPTPPTPTSQQPPSSSSSTASPAVSGANPNSASAPQPVNSSTTATSSNSKTPRPFVNTFGKSPGLPKWPPQPKDSDDQQQQQQPVSQPHQQQPGQQQSTHHQPQINIFDEERQAGSGQSSPASSEGSGPLVKQGSGVFSHHPLPPSSLTQTHPGSGSTKPTSTPTSGQPDQAGQQAPPPPLEPRGVHGGRQGPKPPPRMPQSQHGAATNVAGSQQAASANGQSANRAPNSRTGSVGNAGGDDDVDSSKLSVNDSVNLGLPQAQSTPQQGPSEGTAGTGGIHLNQRPAPTYRYASKSVIANTYMGRLGNAAMERYQQLNKQIYNTSHNAQGGNQTAATTSTSNTTTTQGNQSSHSGTTSEKPTLAGELRTAFGLNQPSPISSADPPGVAGAEAGGQGGVTHFGLVGSPNYPDIASDKGSFKSNTPKHLRRRHSDSDNEELGKVLHRGDKSHQLENVAEDNNNGSNVTNATASSDGKPQNGAAAQRLGNENGDANNDKASKQNGKPKEEKKAAVVTRRKKTILKGENRRKSMNRVSFDPLALLLDASLEGELDLVMRTAKEVDDVSAPNDEGITALHNAICAGHYDIIKFLIEFGADVNSPDSDGWTPLHCAASCNNLPMVRFLVEHGACIFATTISDNETAAEKCEEDEDGYDGCSDYLYSVQEKLGIVNDGTVYAVFDYTAHNNDELSFRINDKMTVLRKGDETEKEWWWTRMIGTGDGYIPRNLLGLYPRVPSSTYQPHQTSEC